MALAWRPLGSTTSTATLFAPRHTRRTPPCESRTRCSGQPGLDGRHPSGSSRATTTSSPCFSTTSASSSILTLALTPEELARCRPTLPIDDRINTNLLAKDGDDHRRLRRLVTKAFTPRMVEQLRPRIQEIADELVDRVEADGEMDLVDEYAFPLPITVIAELLGIPGEDRDRFRAWSNSFVSPPLTAEAQEQFDGHRGVHRVSRRLFARRRSPADDLVSALVQACGGAAGDTLTRERARTAWSCSSSSPATRRR